MRRFVIITILGVVFIALTLLAGCTSSNDLPAATPTSVNPAEVALTMVWQKANAEATQMAVNIQFTATGQVIEATRNVENTQAAVAITEQARKDAQATDAQNRRDAAATEQRKRDDAAATEQRRRDDAATEQTRRDVEATAQQNQLNIIGTATAQQQDLWNQATMEVLPIHNAWTQQAVYIEQTLAANDAELSNLNVEQQRDTNTIDWLAPLIGVAIIIGVFAIVQIRKSRLQKVVNEEDGTVEGVLVDDKLIKLDLMPTPVMDLSGKTPTAPEMTDPETQKAVTRMALGVRALRELPAQMPPQMSVGLYNGVFGEQQTKKPVVQVLPEGQTPKDILEELEGQVVEEE